MTSQTSKTKLPAGFMDITPRVRSTIFKRAKHLKIENDGGDVEYQEQTFSTDQDKAVKYILYGVVKYKGEYLTSFTDNKPVVGNDMNTTVDACKMNTKALSRKQIEHIIGCTFNFQRYAYYPGFPRFLTVDGATTFNTWQPQPRLTITNDDFEKWSESKTKAFEVAREAFDTEAAITSFTHGTTPMIWEVMLRMLFGNDNSPEANPDWSNEHDVFTKWFACVVHKPLVRTRWVPVLRGAHGIGKGTFQHMARALIGSGGVSVVQGIEGVAGQFGGENALARLLIVDEVWSKSDKLMEAFKPIVSDDFIGVERKGEMRFTTRSVADTLVFSNHGKPFKSAATERRWWVAGYRNLDQGPDVSKEIGQAFHAECAKLVRKAMPLGSAGDQSQIRDLLCWLKLVAMQVPSNFCSTAPPSSGFDDLIDLAIEDAHDGLVSWLDKMDTKDALSLSDVVVKTGVAQSQLVNLLGEKGFRSCQMKSEGGRKVWTKALVGVGPNHLREYGV
jgi:hypothetical protein